MLVSFVLPAYKANYLREAIQSILNQKYTNFELIIVNDASPQNIEDIVFSFNDKRIKYYKNDENIGGGDLVKNWNLCISYAQGDFIVLASDDDLYMPGYLETMIDLYNRYPHVDLYHCRIRYIDFKGDFIAYSQPAAEYETTSDFIYQRLFYNRKQAAPEFMFKKKAIERIGGFVDFPIAWYSDDATWNALSINGVAYSSIPLLNFRLSGLNLSTFKIKPREKLLALKMYKKWIVVFLKNVKTDSADDKVMLKKCRDSVDNILNGHFICYVPYISPFKDFIIECWHLIFLKGFSFRMLMYIFFRKILIWKS